MTVGNDVVATQIFLQRPESYRVDRSRREPVFCLGRVSMSRTSVGPNKIGSLHTISDIIEASFKEPKGSRRW
jgi:hypothetical protein